ncbi:type II toxin-antitoxin system VapB family antitoxin [uncultured Actinomyces sp.]|uniref:type II toxin-antitoxin system VapB family antitoxin n=1 Tax=uncultured Actinomyces sp. TaxID=249061 RepID=UPI002618432A|nr:type II toxin-antitoxin system VapB family antitoxin [uncultured Actinomyces sp.]
MTIDVDDELLACAAVLTGIEDRAVLIQHGLELLVRIESGRQIAVLGGADPAAEAAPRRRKRA